jgi:hypothetical protein
MALEYQVVSADCNNEEECALWLSRGWEPFAIAPEIKGGQPMMWFRSQVWNEDAEPKSSTKAENKNYAGNEPDRGE